MTWQNLIKIFLGAINILALGAPDGCGMAVIMVTTLVLFSTEVIPPVSSSLVILVLMFFHFPAARVQDVFSGFRSPVLFFLLATTAMGIALSRSTMARLLKNWLAGRLAEKFPAVLRIALLLPPLALAVPSSITRNAMLYPVLRDLVDRGIDRKEARDIFLVLGMINPLASSAFLTGGLAPLISSDLLGGFSWWQWLAMMGIPYFILMTAGVGYILVRRKRQSDTAGEDPAREDFKEEKAVFSRDDYALGGIMLLVVLLWATDFWHGFHPVVPALLGFLLVLLFYPPAGWVEIQKSRAFENMVILGVLFSLINLAEGQGLLDQFSRGVAAIFPTQLPAPAALLLMVALTAVFHLFIPNISVCLTILLPLFVKISPVLGVNPVVAGLVTTMTVDTLNYYPAQSTPLLMVYDRDCFRPRDVFKFGLAMTVIFVLALFAVILPYWGLLGIKLGG